MSYDEMSVPILAPVTKEIVERVRSKFGLNEESMREAVQLLRDWLELQPHLPQEPDNGRLERWVIRCKNSLEKSKQSLDLYFTVKNVAPNLMSNWDTTAEWFKISTSTCFLFPLPELNENDERIVCYGLQSDDTAKFNLDDFFKLTLMSLEIRMCEDYCSSDIYIIDMSKFTLGHVAKFSIPGLIKYEVCAMEAFKVRIKAMYVINATPYTEVVVGMVKTVFKSKVASRIEVYGKDLTTFYDKIPKDILPQELGGQAGTIAENMDRWKQKLESYHSWFLEREHLMSDESKRPSGVTNTSDIFGFEGSFRKLCLD